MRILIDIGHPAHVHYYRNLTIMLINNGHDVIITVKDIQVAKELLQYYGLSYTLLPKKSDGIFGKILRQIQYNLKLLAICKKENINIGVGTSVALPHVSLLSNVKSIIFDDDDDDVQPLITKYVNPYANALLSPDALSGKRKREDTLYYKGYQELAYLHPNRFQPDPSVLEDVGVQEGDSFFILRFNVFKAHHDIGVRGFSLELKLRLIEYLKPHGKILITTERSIDPELKDYQMYVSPEKIHSLLYYAKMFIGDSQTMTSEAAILGTPAIRCNSFVGRISYLAEQEYKYGLTYGFRPDQTDQMFKKIDELLKMNNLKEEWSRRRYHMLQDKIDVTGFMVWFVENYPASFKIMKEHPEYQYNFK